MSVSIAMPRMSTDPELTTAQSKYLESLARAGAEVHWVELSDPDAAVAEALTCDGLLLPGGGDMDPAFYGQERISAAPCIRTSSLLSTSPTTTTGRKSIPSRCGGALCSPVCWGRTPSS